ncbi:MAG TPA: hypothetical protein GXX57_08405 [Firmicutes bacterium]|nr:hypothetical protein [Bacillota bacterium]
MIWIMSGLVFIVVFFSAFMGSSLVAVVWRWVNGSKTNWFYVGLGGLLLFTALVAGPGLALVLGCGAVVGSKGYAAHAHRRRQRAMENQLADALLLLANGLKAGFSLRQALDMMGREIADPLGAEIRVLAHELELGVELPKAMRRFSAAVGGPDVELAVTAILVQQVTGGNLALALERIAETINERKRLIGKVRAMTSQGRLTGLIISLMPIVLLVFLMVAAPEFVAPLLLTSPGRLLLVVGAIMQGIGALLVWKICAVEF